MQRKSFSSIFNEQKFRKNAEVENDNAAAEKNWTNSDCSSCDVEDETIPPKQRLDSPLKIQDCSGEEEDINENSINRTWSSLNNHSFQNKRPRKRRKTSQLNLSLSSRRKPLELSLKQKSNKEAKSEAARNVLSTQNTSENTKCNATALSPWNNIRNTFAAVQRIQNESRMNLEKPDDNDYDDPNETQINWSISSSDSESAHSSQLIETQTTTSQKSNPPTELDMFCALIERECYAAKVPSKPLSMIPKTCRKGGYLQQLQRTLVSARVDRKFLKHDKNFELQSGTQLRVIKLESAFGVRMATVKVLGNEKDNEQVDDIKGQHFCVVLDAAMARNVEIGSKLEAFFDDNIAPYMCGELTSVFVQPNKLMLL